MKKLTCLILCAAALLVSCIKPHIHPCCTVAQRSAEITAQKNGVAWSPWYVIGTRDISTITIASESLATQATPSTRIDTLSIRFQYTAADTGTYKLNADQVYYAEFSGNEPVTYKLDTTFNNYIKVSSYQRFDNVATTNPNTFEIKGTFNLRFIDPVHQAGIRFSNGTYYALMNQ